MQVQKIAYIFILLHISQGRIQDFKLGGAHLKKLRRAEGGAKNVGVFRVKITILRQKILFFPILITIFTVLKSSGQYHNNPTTSRKKTK
jgi:hypothetical protein